MQPQRAFLVWSTLGALVTVSCSRDEARPRVDSAQPRPAVAQPVPAAPSPTLPDSADADAILRFLTRFAPPQRGGFDDSLIPPLPVDSVLALVSDSGVVINDVNEGADSTVVVSRAELRSQLAARRGRAFTQLGHLAYIASQPYPQYSGLLFTRAGSSLSIEVGSWYVLTFVGEQGRTRLRRVSYEQFEGE